MDTLKLTEPEKQKALELLAELNEIKGPAGLNNWNIRAQTLLVFIAMRNPEAFIAENEVT